MQRQQFDIPLMIGGATTSRAHTAVKVDKCYDHPVVWVKDASRSVTVASKLLSGGKSAFMQGVKDEYDGIRERHAGKRGKEKLLSLDAARANATALDWENYQPPVPQQPGVTVLADYDLAEIRRLIDWTPFFISWEMKGRYPDILNNPTTGEAARKLYEEANAMLDRIVAEKWLTANAVLGLFPAQRVAEDDIEVQAADGSTLMLNMLRQQSAHRAGVPNRSLADFISPQAGQDYVGAFAVTCGIGVEERVKAFKADHDDYQAIMLEALADRLAEAFAELLHQRVRREFWGYAADEALDNDALISEKYQGIRPAPGYAACPEHTEKAKLWQLLDVDNTAGIQLTESYAMWPAAAVSGWYFSHPQSQYFVTGRLGQDQVDDYAQRKGMPLAEAERWLAPYLAYDPDD